MTDIVRFFTKNAPKESGIYKILNTVNGKFYIGSAVSIKNRWSQHIRRFINKTHSNKKLENSFHFHGFNNFEFSVIEIVYDINSLIDREQYWINLLNPANDNIGYNICSIAGSSIGIKQSKESNQKRSNTQKGRPLSEDHIKKLTITNQTKEARERISKIHKGKKLSEDHKIKISQANKGRVNSPESIAKMKETKKITNSNPEYRKKCSDTAKKAWAIKKEKELYNKQFEVALV